MTKKRTAFSSAIMNVMDESIGKLHHAMTNLIKCPLTNRDVATHLLHPDDLPILQRAQEFGLRSGVWRDKITLKLDSVTSVNIDMSSLKLPLPAYVANGNHVPLPEHILQVLADTAAKKLAMSDHWTKVRALVGHLDDTCTSPQQVRYLLPCMVGLLSYDHRTAPLARRLTPMPHLRVVPTVSPAVRGAIADVQRVITQALLIPKDIPPQLDKIEFTFEGTVLYEGWGATSVYEKRLNA
jgi:uncharacterized protein YqgV (UPF0045/DUF77 family)